MNFFELLWHLRAPLEVVERNQSAILLEDLRVTEFNLCLRAPALSRETPW